METTTKEIIKDLHSEAVSSHYSKATWKALLSQRVDGNQLASINSTTAVGIRYLKEQDIVDLAIREYPWMINQIKVEVKDERKDSDGRLTKKSKTHMKKMPAWIDRIRDTGVVRPKDLIHLSNIVDLAENREAIQDMEW